MCNVFCQLGCDGGFGADAGLCRLPAAACLWWIYVFYFNGEREHVILLILLLCDRRVFMFYSWQARVVPQMERSTAHRRYSTVVVLGSVGRRHTRGWLGSDTGVKSCGRGWGV